MKKTLIFICGLALLFGACKKDKSTPASVQNNPAQVHSAKRVALPNLANLVTVSSQGFLVLADSEAYPRYMDFLDSNNAQDITAFHQQIGFVSQAGTQVQGVGNYIPPSYSNGEYLFDPNGMVQIGDVVYRNVYAEGYFLAMPVSSLTLTTYQALVNKTFMPDVMCRLAVGGNYPVGMAAFVHSNIGLDDFPVITTIHLDPFSIWNRVETMVIMDGNCYKIVKSYYFNNILDHTETTRICH